MTYGISQEPRANIRALWRGYRVRAPTMIHFVTLIPELDFLQEEVSVYTIEPS